MFYFFKITYETNKMFRFEKVGWYIGGYAIFKIILYHIKYEIFQCKNSKR